MKKQLLTLALAGAVALPFAASHVASAQTKTNYYSHVYSYSIQPSKGFQNTSYKMDINWGKWFDNSNCNYSGSDYKYNDKTPQQDKQVPNKQEQKKQDQQKQDQNKQAPKQQDAQKSKPAQAQPTQQQTQKPATSNNQQATQKQDQNKTGYTVSAYEKKVVQLTNNERTQRGLQPLKLDVNLSKMARDKSADMSNNNYFAHQSPTYGSPFDMMKSYGISYSSAGENIAAGQPTPEAVVNAWMNSKGHRANILNPSYTNIGVGYVKGGSYGSYWTQEFTG